MGGQGFAQGACFISDKSADAARYGGDPADGQSWWAVDLGSEMPVDVVRVRSRPDCCGDADAADLGVPSLDMNQVRVLCVYVCCRTVRQHAATR